MLVLGFVREIVALRDSLVDAGTKVSSGGRRGGTEGSRGEPGTRTSTRGTQAVVVRSDCARKEKERTKDLGSGKAMKEKTNDGPCVFCGKTLKKKKQFSYAERSIEGVECRRMLPHPS